MDSLITYIPKFLRQSNIYQEIFNAEDQQIALLETNIDDIKAQLSVDTATWGLVIFEKELKISTDLSKPIEDRRSVIKSKMRGTGKVDSILIKLVADAYTNGDVMVSFNGHIVVKFVSQVGIPPNLQDLKDTLEEIKPSYLAIDYEFRYLTISEVSQFTIGQMNETLLENFAGGA